MKTITDIIRGFREDFRESLRWASVRVTAAWGMVWIIYSQLPPDVMVTLANHKIWLFNIPSWMGIGQAVMTYLARMKKPEEV